jgi:hypothetical protein
MRSGPRKPGSEGERKPYLARANCATSTSILLFFLLIHGALADDNYKPYADTDPIGDDDKNGRHISFETGSRRDCKAPQLSLGDTTLKYANSPPRGLCQFLARAAS